MKQRYPFASPCRLLLSCCAAVLVTACGGSTDHTDGQPMLAATVVNEPAAGVAPAQARTGIDAAPVTQDTIEAPVVEAAATAAPIATAPAATTPATGATPPASNQFNLSGYQAGAEGAAPGAADAGQATPPPAA